MYCTMPEYLWFLKNALNLEYALRNCINVENRFSTFLSQFAGECLRIHFNDGASDEDCRRINSFTSLLLVQYPFRQIIRKRPSSFAARVLRSFANHTSRNTDRSDERGTVLRCFGSLSPLHATLSFRFNSLLLCAMSHISFTIFLSY